MQNSFPQNGFYYHYKHNPSKDINNYAYEVIGVGRHTEGNCRDDDKFMVVYRPLYSQNGYMEGAGYNLRPLEMFVGVVVLNGKEIPRFSIITDADILKELESIKQKLYPN